MSTAPGRSQASSHRSPQGEGTPMSTIQRSVAVTGMHRGENPQPGASVVASLRRQFPGLRTVGLSYDPLESSLYGRGGDHPDAAYLIPFPGAGARALLDRLDMGLQHEMRRRREPVEQARHRVEHEFFAKELQPPRVP